MVRAARLGADPLDPPGAELAPADGEYAELAYQGPVVCMTGIEMNEIVSSTVSCYREQRTVAKH